MNRFLRTRIPRRAMWAFTALLVGLLCEAAFRPNIRVQGLHLKARMSLPVRASREQVVAWLDANGLPYRPVFDKGGGELLWYLVRAKQAGSWLRSDADFWMTFNFYGGERLSDINTGLD